MIADEPTTALDITTQWEILGLLGELKREQGLTVLMVSHDLRVIQSISDDLCVMYAGYVIEQGPVSEVLENPLHPYTKGLFGLKARIFKKKQSGLWRDIRRESKKKSQDVLSLTGVKML